MNFFKNLLGQKKPTANTTESISSYLGVSEPSKQSIDEVRFTTKPIDWDIKVTDEFMVEGPISFANEQDIIVDLKTANLESFTANMKWNLTLCLAYGSDKLSTAAAKAIFKVIRKSNNFDSLLWITNTILNTGDVPSKINWDKGVKGLRTLLVNCPKKYQDEFYSLIVDNVGFDIDYSYNPDQDDSKNVVFVQETRNPDPYRTAIATYRVYRGDSKKAAYDFLTKNIVKEKMLFLVVETPEGNFCRDINGIYKERR